MARKLKIPKMKWEQIDGDVNFARYGGTFASSHHGESLHVIKIQPVREYVGDAEAEEVGFPYWTKEGYFDLDDLRNALKDQSFTSSMDMDNVLEGLNPEQAALAVAASMLDYGKGDEGPAGWAEDITQAGFPKDIIEALEEEDDEFRSEVLYNEEEDEED